MFITLTLIFTLKLSEEITLLDAEFEKYITGPGDSSSDAPQTSVWIIFFVM